MTRRITARALFLLFCLALFSVADAALAQRFWFPGGLWSSNCGYNAVSRPTADYVGTRRAMFNGEDLTGWTNVEGKEPGAGWKVVDGCIFRESGGGDLYAEGEYENFIWEFEFKLAEKGNSGVKYRSWNKTGWGMGCEYQIYDDINDAKNPPRYQTGALYDVIEPREGAPKIKMGEFNKGKIVVLGNHIEHYLNGELVMSTDVGSDAWNEGVAKSKFKDVKEFGVTTIGRVFLQDHNCQVWFKNIYMTELKPTR